ncbi:YfhO family protein, partial [Streptococcus sobrinus]
YTAKKAGSLFFTLPYDKGWSAKVNGKPVKIRKGQKGFMVVDIPAGKGQVKLSFLPNGFKLASLLSLAGFTLFIIYNYGYRHFLQKKAKASGH